MEGKRNFFQMAAEGFKEIAFLQVAFPVLTVIGGGVFVYFGMKGVFTRKTISLSRTVGGFHPIPIEGKAAVFLGLIYLIVAVLLSGFLGAISFYIYTGP